MPVCVRYIVYSERSAVITNVSFYTVQFEEDYLMQSHSFYTIIIDEVSSSVILDVREDFVLKYLN